MPVPISNVTRRVVYAPSGAGGAGPYAFTFEILANTDIAVYKDDTLLTLTTHYTVSIAANGTGSVTITAAGLALAPLSPTQYAIVGNRTISRSTDFTTGGDFFANTLNDELDQQTIFAQQNAEGLARALIAPQTDPLTIDMTLPRKADRAGKYLAFDVDGNPDLGVSVVDVTDIAGLAAEIAALSAVADEIETVAGIESQVTTVSGDSADIQSLATKTVQIGVIGDDLAGTGWSHDLGLITDAAPGVPAATPDGYIVAVYNALADVETVADIDADVTTVAGIAADITAVANLDPAELATIATDIAAVKTVADDLLETTSEIDTVANSIANVDTVATNLPNIDTVAGISANVTTVAGIAANVTTVAGISANVTTVAGISADVSTVAGDSADIQFLADNIGTIASKANAGANSDITSMTAVTSITSTGALTLASGGTNQDITIDPSGTGKVSIPSDLEVTGTLDCGAIA